jgi:hypothetical protein
MPALLVFGWYRSKEKPHPLSVSGHLSRFGPRLVSSLAPSCGEGNWPGSCPTNCTIRIVPQSWSGIETIRLRKHANLCLVGD